MLLDTERAPKKYQFMGFGFYYMIGRFQKKKAQEQEKSDFPSVQKDELG